MKYAAQFSLSFFFFFNDFKYTCMLCLQESNFGIRCQEKKVLHDTKSSIFLLYSVSVSAFPCTQGRRGLLGPVPGFRGRIPVPTQKKYIEI